MFPRGAAVSTRILASMTRQRCDSFPTAWLDVGDGHSLYFEEVGTAAGTPVVHLDGGPGSGCTPGARRILAGLG
jgi:hypothetical protein